jgi:TonB-dependent starch-binding outer membrane protein SusC
MKKISLVLSLVLFAIGFAAAQRTVTGTVSDQKGEPMVGSSVLVKGTTTGVVSDIDGKYTLNVPAGATTLVFSFAGYVTQEATLGASNVIDISLQEATLQEIIVTGTGAGTDKRKVAIDVQTLSAKNMPPSPTASVDQALVGKIAGAQISSVNGTPGAKANILLRGINTINRGTSPMIMMDGVEMGATDLNTVDLSTVERVEVVQGAAAASIYGAQGANGVIQLFTKKGKNGQLNIDFSTSYVSSTALNIGNVRKADLHGFETNASNEVVSSSGKPLVYDNSIGTYSANVIWNSTNPAVLINKPYDKNLQYVDHLAMFLQTAPTTNNSLNISGGKDNFDFLIGASHNYQKSNLIDNGDFSRSNLTANIGVELIKGLKLRSVTQLGYTKSTINDGGGNATIFAMFNTRPFIDYSKKMDDGNYPAFQGSAGGPNATNPFFINQYTRSNNNKIDLIQSVNLNYQPVKWLELDAKYGLNYQTRNDLYNVDNQSENPNVVETEYYSRNWVDGFLGERSNQQYSNRFMNLLTSATLRFDIGSNIKSSTFLAYDYRNRLEQDYITYTYDLPTLAPVTSVAGTTPFVQRDRKTPFITFGYVASQHFEYGDIIGVTGGFRTDYSSAFGSGSKAFFFPRGDAFVRLSAMDFWKNISNVIPEFKLRGSFGSAGIQPKPFDRYVTLGTRKLGSSNVLYSEPNQSNPELDVEVSKEIQIGADFTFALGKGDWFRSVSFSPTYWKRNTDNAIWDVDGIPSAGISTYKNNAFGLGSNGIQFILGVQIADKKDFAWRLTTNFGRQSSEITKVNGPPVILTTAAGSTGYVLEEGLKIGQLFGWVGLKEVGALDKEGKPYISADKQGLYEVASNGWVVNKTTKAPYFSENQESFGDPNPTFIANFINNITIKNFVSVNFQIDWVQGSHIYNQTKGWMYRDGIHSDYQEPFTVNGQTGAWSAFYRGVYAERSRNGTKNYFYEDASFVRLRNVELMFDLARITNIKGLKRCQLVLAGRNLWTATKYTGMDPEINSSNVYATGESSAWDRGTDHNTMPNLRSYQIGLNVGF